MECIRVSDNRRYIIKEDGTPFFWLGDTAWDLFHKLSREEARLYLENRREKGFNVIQAVALGEDEGLTRGNAYERTPLLKNVNGKYDPYLPDTEGEYSYWQHVDYIIDMAAEMGLYIGFLPTWGDKFNIGQGKGPVIFNHDNAFRYGKWLGERYKDRNNIIWILGGDRKLETAEHFAIINGMAAGIREGDDGRHLMTFHPSMGISSSQNLHNERWLDFNMIQSGHGPGNVENYKNVEHDYNLIPVKPVLDGEPRYEDSPIFFNPQNGYFDDYDVRQAAYWAVFSGAFGHTYGHHSIWRMCTEPAEYFIMHWKDALDRPGASQMKHLKNLMESRPFLECVPDQSLVVDNYKGQNHMAALRGRDFAYIYSPNGLKMKISLGKTDGTYVNASWYNPRTGVSEYIAKYKNSGTVEFVPLSSGRNNDWILVLHRA